MLEIQQVQEQIRCITYEINGYINLLYITPCVYTRNTLLNLIRDRLYFINLLVSELRDENILHKNTPTAIKSLKDGGSTIEAGNTIGMEKITKGIQPGQLQNISIEAPKSDFTVEELSKYNGKNGRPAYVAVKGVVYDVTNNAAWAAATHFGLIAGTDLSRQFLSCHSGQNILSKLNVVGRLI